MFQVGDLIYWHDDPSCLGYVLRSDENDTTVQWIQHGRQVKKTKYLKRVEKLDAEETATTPKLSGWQDQSDSSRYENVRPGIHAVCAYAADGSSWEWGVLTKQTGSAFVGEGRSIDRRTAKSDAEFFIVNYKPEDTTERDELRRKLEKSWSGS